MVKNTKWILGILIPVFTFGNFLALLVTPALPGMTRAFDVSVSGGSWVMSLFLLGYAFGQLPYGPLAKRFGRKGALTIGSSLAVIGSLLAWIAPTFSVLCIARILQALGAGVGLKITVTIVSDLYSGEAAARMMSILAMAFGAIPALATALGGFITLWFGWRTCFLFLAVYSGALWMCTRLLPETAPEIDKQALHLKKILSGYVAQFRNASLVLYAILAGLTAASMYIFATLSPYIGIDRIGLRPDTYGFLAMTPWFGLMIGAWIGRCLSGRNVHLVMLAGIVVYLLSTFAFAFFFLRGELSIWILFAPAIAIYLGNTWIWARAFTQAMEGVQDKSNAAAVMQFLNIGTATAGTFIIDLFSPANLLLLPICLGIIAIFLVGIWLTLRCLARL